MRQRTFKPRRRRLSPTRQRRFDELAPDWVLDVAGEPIDLADVFGNDADIVLDIGIGRGESCVEMAAADPATNIVGIDVHTPGIAGSVLAIAERGLTNLRLVEGDVLDFADRLAPGSIAGLRIYFPDPWPKPKHHRRRIVSPERIERLVQLVRVGGWLHLATDIADYAVQMQRVCDAHPDLDGGVIERPESRPLTRYEQRGLDAGRQITDLWYERRRFSEVDERQDPDVNETVGRPRPAVAAMPSYRPGKGAKQAEAEHGISDAIKLASNEHPDPTLDPLADAVAIAARSLHLYADHRATAVREAVASHLGLTAEQITVGNGSVGLLQQLCLSFVDPGDEVVYPWRSFEVYPVFTRLMSGTPVEVPLADDLGPDIDGLIAACTDRTKLLFLATPNNPTGVATTTADLKRLLDGVDSSIVVCVDEAYREFLDPGYGDPVAELIPEHPNLIVTRTFSKAHGLAGARVGYGVGHPDLIATVDKTLLPFAVSALAQAGALAALQHLDALDAAAARILAERARIEVELAGRGWELPRHQGNFIWLGLGDRTDEIALGLEQRGVVVRPFSGDGIRVTVSTAEHNDRFLTALAEVAAP